jgi:hypothetical protein
VTTATTDVREWLRGQGEDVPERGPIPKSLRARYDEAHVTAPPELDDEPDAPAAAGDSYDGGVSADDFVSAAAPPATAPAAPGRRHAGERKPRSVRGQRQAGGTARKLWARASGSSAADGKEQKPKARKRISLEGFVEDLYADLAWLAGGAGAVPLARMLQVQASYAGVIAEQQFKDTIADTVLQPVARAQGALAAFNGLVGPPVFVGGIMTAGQRVQMTRPVVDDDGRPVYQQGPDGAPVRDPETGELIQAVMIVEDFDTRTKMMFVGLRYCLLQMTKVTDKAAADIIAHGEQRMARGREVDQMIAWIFNMPAPPTESSDEEEAIKRAQSLIGGAA